MNRFIKYVCLSLSIIAFSIFASPTKLVVVDQNGEPVKNAVVAFPAPENFHADTQTLAVMDQVARQFLPKVLVINKGQSVKFPNSDDIRHNVYSFSAVKPFEIKLYKGSNVEPITFENAGISVLGCNIHDDMVGHIYISDNEIAQVTDEDRIVEFTNLVPDNVFIWHPKLSIGSTSKQQFPIVFENNKAQIAVDLLVVEKTRKKRTFGSRNKGDRD